MGWEVTVLSVEAAEIAAPTDSFLSESLPPDVTIIRVKALSIKWCRRFGLGNLGWRALPALWRRGNRLLNETQFSLVYFSTTQFACFPLGRIWQRRFRLPYILDLQDPWVNPYYHGSGAPPPPGGWKYHFAHTFALILEKWTLRKASHVIAVSPAYLRDLKSRYPWFKGSEHGSVIPFGWSRRDLDAIRRERSDEPQKEHVAYYGRVGEDMRPLLSWFFRVLKEWQDKLTVPSRLHFHFVGTTYDQRSNAAGIVTQEANAAGLQDWISEQPERVGFAASLRGLLDSKASLILGSTDLSYTPSKIGPTMAAGRPWLAIVHSNSEAAKRLRVSEAAAEGVFHYDQPSDADRLNRWLTNLLTNKFSDISPHPTQAFLDDEAQRLAQKHVEIFSRYAVKSPPCPEFSTPA